MLPEEPDWLVWFACLVAYDFQTFFALAAFSSTL